MSGAPGIVTCAPEAAASRRGRFIASACDLVVLVHDQPARQHAGRGAERRAAADLRGRGGRPDGNVLLSDLSGDGRWIAFSATSALLGFPRVSPWGDVFVSGPWP